MPRLSDLQKSSVSNRFNEEGFSHLLDDQEDEILISDIRGGVRPTEFVERKLQVVMQRPAAPSWDVSLHVQ